MAVNNVEIQSVSTPHHIKIPVIEKTYKSSGHLLTEYICADQTETFRGSHTKAYRGEPSATFHLVPSALRDDRQEDILRMSRYSGLIIPNVDDLTSDNCHVDAEYAIMQYFYRTANENGLSLPTIAPEIQVLLQSNLPFSHNSNVSTWIPSELLELCALMQHFGMPTRMLDWTTSILVALYFAASGAVKRLEYKESTDEDHMVIWVLSKGEYTNGLFMGEDFSFPIKLITPPYSNNANLNAQKGIMSYLPFEYCKDRLPLDKMILAYYKDRTCLQTVLTKCLLPIRNCYHTLKILSGFGVNATSVFPGYRSIYPRMLEESCFSSLRG